MQISQGNLQIIFTNFQSAFNKELENAQSHYKDVAMIVPSSTAVETYGFLNNLPSVREWVGSRVIHSLGTSRFSIVNRNWEQTIDIDRNDIEDDRYGLFGPVIRDMALSASSHPDELIFGLLGDGFTQKCYDGQPFFSANHVVGTGKAQRTVSNVFGSGTYAPWFLLDCSRPIRPLIFQSRRPVTFTQKTDPRSGGAFFDNKYYYGADARYNAGYGMWQLAFACTDPLTPYNYAAVRAAMMSQRSENGRPLGIRPTHLVTLPGNENAALRILRSQTIEATSNEWAGTAIPIITQFLLCANGSTAAWEKVADFVNPSETYAAGSGTTADGKPPAASGK
ncbi:Mu-like prophage major head subunit gpT family protein [Acetobacter orleanensis]|uniref:Head protein n=1 Tax=Acetobacter orleanensis TaxID=104099 RepID=A0A4Y3TPA3_9PROT|nr:Mu-like prophage major head subunit gpT family protein [Acetobacter orleanensis]GAN68550.1 Mu-like prophage FluMu major head subunit [Acetobacter orleanensis JCM 7639]GBR22981.1 Mu-like prophage major head subunit gpT [Acetobacter orleanensis NRIC 0473]GEB82645.1 head protein [Acetobacter orleanensis]